MITRIVKLTFRDSTRNEFKDFSQTVKSKILSFDGCRHLDFFQDVNNPNIFFTYSLWDSESHLGDYLKSDFFDTIWPKVRKMFGGQPEAWSVEKM